MFPLWQQAAMPLNIHFAEGEPQRECGDCQLCCKLLPVKELAKRAGERCRYQRHHKGCAIHRALHVTVPSCALWNCRWLVNDDTADLRRPDRARYVIDVMPDYVTLRNNETGEGNPVQVVQIWIDPGFPDAHRDPALRAYLERRAKEGIAAFVRRGGDRSGLAIFAPELSANRQWNEVESNFTEAEHTLAEVAAALEA